MSPHQDSRIFVADDEHVSAPTLAVILQKSGFSARFFTCPREALAATRSEAPDLLKSECDNARAFWGSILRSE